MKKVLITGASSGIGLELAKIYAKNNFSLILVARREEKLNEIKSKLESQYAIDIKIEILDLTIRRNLDYLAEKYKGIDILINNAGFGQYGNFKDYELNIDEAIVNLNVICPMVLTKLFAENMRPKGKIINIASTAGFQPVPFMATYGASKSFVIDFTLAIQREYEQLNILLFCPGETQTEFQKVAHRPKSSILRGPIPKAEDVALSIYKNEQKNNKIAIYGFYNKILIFIGKFFGRKTLAYFLAKTQTK